MTERGGIETRNGLGIIGPRVRRRPGVGSVFTYSLQGRSLFGRVIEDGVGPRYAFSGEQTDRVPMLLVYAYDPAVEVLHATGALKDFLPPDILMPPCIMNATGWRDGVFRTVGERELRPGEALPVHHFLSPRGFWVDEHDSPVEPPERGVLWGLTPMMGVSGYGYFAEAAAMAIARSGR